MTGQPFPGNQIPLSRISPIARTILNNPALYPLPNRAVSGVTGNFVGETLTTIRAHQADVRIDWNASRNDKVFGRFSFAEYDSRNDQRAFPLLLGSRTDAPFRNLAFNWNRVIRSSLVNEVLVGYNQITIVTGALDWAGIGNANETFGIASGQPIPGLSSIGWGSGLSSVGAGASNTDTLDKTYQINQKLTWLKGRHTALDCSPTEGASPGSRSRISSSIRSQRRGAAAFRNPGRTCTTAWRCSSRTTSS